MTMTAIAAFVVADVVLRPEALPMLVSWWSGYVAAHAAQVRPTADGGLIVVLVLA
jgi:hypothetical protein